MQKIPPGRKKRLWGGLYRRMWVYSWLWMGMYSLFQRREFIPNLSGKRKMTRKNVKVGFWVGLSLFQSLKYKFSKRFRTKVDEELKKQEKEK